MYRSLACTSQSASSCARVIAGIGKSLSPAATTAVKDNHTHDIAQIHVSAVLPQVLITVTFSAWHADGPSIHT
jgi:hypothetical protein